MPIELTRRVQFSSTPVFRPKLVIQSNCVAKGALITLSAAHSARMTDSRVSLTFSGINIDQSSHMFANVK